MLGEDPSRPITKALGEQDVRAFEGRKATMIRVFGQLQKTVRPASAVYTRELAFALMFHCVQESLCYARMVVG